ncbi:MAG: cyanophycinase [Bacteroidota bacterium]
MNRTIILLSAFINLFALFSSAQPAYKGKLVIVGGGLEADNKSIFQQLIGFAGGAGNAAFAIIPSAGGAPMQSFVYFKNILVSYGLKPENIHLIPVAVMDDDSTKDVNESEWKDNGKDPRLAEIVSKCTAVWFTGGDQLRTTKALYLPDGSQTPVLKAVWDVYLSGGVIGGTSAGAAIMSGVMIGGGTSIAALGHGVMKDFIGDDFPEDQGLLITRGFGFFPCGIVDQHFNIRARIGRLAMALMNEKQQIGMGFGVDENTALIFDGKQNRVSVAGAAGVTILGTSDARITYTQKLPCISNLSLSYLEEGDSFDVSTGLITPAGGKLSTRGNEHHKDHFTDQGGLLSANKTSFREAITAGLADNNATDTIRSITFSDNARGFMLTLRKTPSSEGFSSGKPSYRYTVAHIMMDITPVNISVKPINDIY